MTCALLISIAHSSQLSLRITNILTAPPPMKLLDIIPA